MIVQCNYEVAWAKNVGVLLIELRSSMAAEVMLFPPYRKKKHHANQLYFSLTLAQKAMNIEDSNWDQESSNKQNLNSANPSYCFLHQISYPFFPRLHQLRNLSWSPSIAWTLASCLRDFWSLSWAHNMDTSWRFCHTLFKGCHGNLSDLRSRAGITLAVFSTERE